MYVEKLVSGMEKPIIRMGKKVRQIEKLASRMEKPVSRMRKPGLAEWINLLAGWAYC